MLIDDIWSVKHHINCSGDSPVVMKEGMDYNRTQISSKDLMCVIKTFELL